MSEHDEWTSQLSAFLDGELLPDQKARLERHLGECVMCRSALEDLRAIVAAAPDYVGAEPPRDLWPGISAAIEERKNVRFPAPSERRPARRFTGWQLAAASIAAAVVGLGAAWVVLRGGTAATLAGPEAGTPAETEIREVRLSANEAYDQAVADLEQVLEEGRSRLDTATVRVIEENLRLIDRAIAEARDVIAADPANVDLLSWIASNRQRKLDLLRRAASAIALRTTES
ncbi:MAG TPA: zf-HC2 domain-containing protein [Gemmatimonadales bacterium]